MTAAAAAKKAKIRDFGYWLSRVGCATLVSFLNQNTVIIDTTNHAVVDGISCRQPLLYDHVKDYLEAKEVAAQMLNHVSQNATASKPLQALCQEWLPLWMKKVYSRRHSAHLFNLPPRARLAIMPVGANLQKYEIVAGSPWFHLRGPVQPEDLVTVAHSLKPSFQEAVARQADFTVSRKTLACYQQVWDEYDAIQRFVSSPALLQWIEEVTQQVQVFCQAHYFRAKDILELVDAVLPGDVSAKEKKAVFRDIMHADGVDDVPRRRSKARRAKAKQA